ncbi:MAG: class I tRNA ligase family protein [Candidatus Peribacteraceae bacterium]|nr:class I tRNA ligase family protein [Candidatus Peribacteraceae bacterium]
MFDSVDPKQSLPDLELGILKYWREEDTFKRSMHRREKGEIFSFYDGPPFATGLPHYGHILAGTIKDVIPRYQTMRGKFVKRRFGWDCHGLPVENEIEKEKGLTSKKDIETLGIANFNNLCRTAVQRYTGEWRSTVERLGRFVDMDWDYRTMDADYMESIWWVFKQLHEQKLIYEGYKSMHICPRCVTPLSNFEVTQGYRDRTDQSVIMTFPLVDDPKTVILAWTTTPWSLPGNIWLAMKDEIHYVKVKEGDTTYIVAKKLVEKIFKKRTYEITGDIKASELVGKKYVPLFNYFVDKVLPSSAAEGKPVTYGEKAFNILLHPEVSEDEGTGIVHMTTSYGEDGFELAKKLKVDVLHHVTTDNNFFSEVTDFKGMLIKPEGKDPMSTDKAIIRKLKEMGRHFDSYTVTHSYPHCWRCDTPLLNYATSSWFVAVEKIKETMLKSNAQTQWVPSHLRDGRFGKWLEGARDWAISRNRFWGTPLPIWRNTTTGEVEVIGSRSELMAKAPTRFTKIFISRHAESQGNVDKIYQCKEPSTPLTDNGQQQAKALADRLKEQADSLPVKVIYCSPLRRTRETAEAVAKATGAKIIIDERLKEVDFGEYEGKHVDFDDLTFVRERRAHKLEQGQVESIYHFHGMETWADVGRRVESFLKEILPKHRGESISIVTHADPIMNIVHFFTGQEPNKIVHQPYPALASLRTFYWDHERNAQMDLHKESVDGIVWNKGSEGSKGNKGSEVEVTLVRHGETDLNKLKIVQGSGADTKLNKTGRTQAKQAAEQLKGQQFDVIISSPLKRAKETATIIAKELGVADVKEGELFTERNVGEWDMKPVKDIESLLNDKAFKGICFSRSAGPNGESFDRFIERAQRAHDFLLKEYAGKRVLLISHGGFSQAFRMVAEGIAYEDMPQVQPRNGAPVNITLRPQMRRIEEVLDCWFESGSMPYAQDHFPFEVKSDSPVGFPADFIAEGLDQTRGWFYTLMVLSSALFKCPAFKHCVVNGIVLAEDGKKMSKRLKNYPEPTEVVKKHGADAVRFALMASPAVRGEDLRFSEKLVEETVRSVLLPLWNTYRLFVTYANAANWKPSLDSSLKNGTSTNQLDRWIILKTQELVNNMTTELDGYDLSATCAHLADSIDDLTNWYVRLSRRRFSAKEEGGTDALDTLYRVIIANCQLLAPFCPFVTEAIYLNLVEEDHGSIHFTDWPVSVQINEEDQKLLQLMESTRQVVTLGLSLRSDAKIRVRQPLQSVTFALPPSDAVGVVTELIKEELNVKQVIRTTDASALASSIVQVDARKVGPRLGKKVQEVIKAGKEGKFEEKDGVIIILGETLSPEEAKIIHQSKEGQTVAANRGIVVTLDIAVNEALENEGAARELIHAIQTLRKESGLEFTDTITLQVDGGDEIVSAHKDLIESETRSEIRPCDEAEIHEIDVVRRKLKIRFKKK